MDRFSYSPLPVHVFTHVGVWRTGDKDRDKEMERFHAERGALFVAVNCLIPAGSHPQIKDVAAALSWLMIILQTMEAIGANWFRAVIQLAHLVTLLARDASYLSRYGLTTDLFQAAVPVDTASFDFTRPLESGSENRLFAKVLERKNC